VNRARRDLCGGCSAMGIPTASIAAKRPVETREGFRLTAVAQICGSDTLAVYVPWYLTLPGEREAMVTAHHPMARVGGKNAACASSSGIAAATTIRDRRC